MHADRQQLAEIMAACGGGAVQALTHPLNRPADSTDPTAREWLSRWGPSALRPKPPSCTCAEGHCRICN